MIGWAELIGRFVSFTVEKLVGRKIDLLLSDRRRAARGFLRFYQALGDLEVLLKEIVVEGKAIDDAKPEISKEWFHDITLAVDQTSERFLEAGDEITDAIEIFDPVLAQTVNDLSAHKFSFLIYAANGFQAYDKDGQSLDSVKYTVPQGELASIDLESQYNWYKDNYPLDCTKSLEWPQWVSAGFVDDEDVRRDFVCISDMDSIKRLLAMVEVHVASLSEAREKFALFIRDNFSIEDLLAVRDPITQFDRIHASIRASNAAGLSYRRFFAHKSSRRVPRE